MKISEFIALLPSGSGFNCNWEHIKKCKNGTHIFETYYHNMDEHGYYDGHTKVRLRLPKQFKDFHISLVGKKKYVDSYMRDYFWDCVNYSLEGLTAFNLTDS